MDNARLFLWSSLAFVLVLLYQAWQEDYAAQPEPVPVTTAQDELPTQAAADASLPSAVADPSTPAAAAPAAVEPAVIPVVVETDVLRLVISPRGGEIIRAELKEFPEEKEVPDVPVVLFQGGDQDYSYQTGMVIAGLSDGPTHLATFAIERERYELADGEDELEVVMTWRGEGLALTKRLRFTRGSYLVDVTQEVLNTGDAARTALPYAQLQRRYIETDRSLFSVEGYSYRGPVYYDGSSYDKLSPDDLSEEPLDAYSDAGWAAVIEHYFVAALVPEAGERTRYQAEMLNDGRYIVRATPPTIQVAAGASSSVHQRMYVGPKTQSVLEEIAPELDLVVDYGTLHLISKPLFIGLEWIHAVVGNWGWAIIILTLLIKLAFYKLSETSGRSMAKMRKLQPRLKSLQERYKDDKQKLNEHMMKLYQEEKINPAAGCLPILIQLPVFLALYWVLLESVELRQAPFLLWLDDLSSKDPYFVLPVLMGASMLIQQKLNPQPPDPVQAKVMTILPVVFTAFFAFFPSGLVLYWFTNNLLTIAQQWKINRVVEAEK